MADGYLLGSLSVYSGDPVTVLKSRFARQPIASYNSSLQGILRAWEEEARTKRMEEAFDGELARSAASLAVLGVIHDVSSLVRVLSQILDEDLPLELQASGATSGALELLENGQDAVKTLSSIAEHMKSIGQAKSRGRMRVNVQEVLEELSPLLESVVKVSSKGKTSLVIKPARGKYSDFDVEADPAKLDRAIINLVDNAAYWAKNNSSGRGMVKLSVGAVRGEQGERRVQLSVADNGSGIASEIKPFIFQRFKTSRADGGTGIGLYLVKRFVDEMNGRVVVESGNEGAIFVVDLPHLSAVPGVIEGIDAS